MSDRIVLVIGSVLAVGGLLVAALAIRPRPGTIREVAYLVIPLLGAIVLAMLAWGRT